MRQAALHHDVEQLVPRLGSDLIEGVQQAVEQPEGGTLVVCDSHGIPHGMWAESPRGVA